jgi:hypothetical protein
MHQIATDTRDKLKTIRGVGKKSSAGSGVCEGRGRGWLRIAGHGIALGRTLA